MLSCDHRISNGRLLTIRTILFGNHGIDEVYALDVKKPDSPGGVVEDERDNLILTRAVSVASVTFWWVFIISCFLLWFLIGPDRTMPTIVLPLMALGGATFIKTVCSIAILVQYHREAENG